jgi:hypothetical protein
MPNPLPATPKTAQQAIGVLPLAVAAVWDVVPGNLRGVTGVPVPIRGSILYQHAVSFGYIVKKGWDTRGRIIRGTMSGREDTKWKKA